MMLIGSFLLLVVLFFVHLMAHFSLQRYMKSNHDKKYIELFGGGTFADASISRQKDFWLFLKRREYENLFDPELVTRCVFYKRISVVYLIIFALVIFSFVWGIATR